MAVAIVGVGLHPFGRFADRTGIDMGAIAIRRALADAGVEWRDIGHGAQCNQVEPLGEVGFGTLVGREPVAGAQLAALGR